MVVATLGFAPSVSHGTLPQSNQEEAFALDTVARMVAVS